MIKFAATRDDGGRLIGFGISRENVERLKAGRPILVKLAHLARMEVAAEKCEILLFYGDDEESMQKALQPFIGPETAVHDLRKPQN